MKKPVYSLSFVGFCHPLSSDNNSYSCQKNSPMFTTIHTTNTVRSHKENTTIVYRPMYFHLASNTMLQLVSIQNCSTSGRGTRPVDPQKPCEASHLDPTGVWGSSVSHHWGTLLRPIQAPDLSYARTANQPPPLWRILDPLLIDTIYISVINRRASYNVKPMVSHSF